MFSEPATLKQAALSWNRAACSQSLFGRVVFAENRGPLFRTTLGLLISKCNCLRRIAGREDQALGAPVGGDVDCIDLARVGFSQDLIADHQTF